MFDPNYEGRRRESVVVPVVPKNGRRPFRQRGGGKRKKKGERKRTIRQKFVRSDLSPEGKEGKKEEEMHRDVLFPSGHFYPRGGRSPAVCRRGERKLLDGTGVTSVRSLSIVKGRSLSTNRPTGKGEGKKG